MFALGVAGVWWGPPVPATPIPASIVRPAQATPDYPSQAKVFTLGAPVASPVFLPTATATMPAAENGGASAVRDLMQYLAMEQTPSATGIAAGGATIYEAPGGRALGSIPVAGLVTITGKSADGNWYAVYDDGAVFGWTPTGQLRVFGGDDLIVVEKSLDPAPVATLIAQAMEPVQVLDVLMPTLEAMAAEQKAVVEAGGELSMVNEEATPPPTAQSTTVISGGAGITGTVVSDGRLNLRAEPSTSGAIVAKLAAGSIVRILERSADGKWLQVSVEGNTGWVSAEFVGSNE
ncbi:MAG: SH3 domain-containing protein [Anaerolineales bacterium]|nr:SH3 domain-containing protein [Anaerolineales bacterium]